MSERLMQRLRAAVGGLLLCSLAGLASAQQDCAPISENFVICPADTPWAGAEWMQFGDGVALQLNGYYLEFTEHWGTRQDGAALEVALDALIGEMDAEDRAEGVPASRTLLRDRFESGSLQIVRVVQDIDIEDDEPLLLAVMLAEGAGARIALILGHDDDIALDALDGAARDLAALIHPAQER